MFIFPGIKYIRKKDRCCGCSKKFDINGYYLVPTLILLMFVGIVIKGRFEQKKTDKAIKAHTESYRNMKSQEEVDILNLEIAEHNLEETKQMIEDSLHIWKTMEKR